MTSDRILFTYGEFYDVPRQILVRFGEEWFLLRSFFDEQKDDYADVYEVFLLPYRSEEEIAAQPYFWRDVSGHVNLGRIGIKQVGLDATRRQSIDGEAFGKWLASCRKTNS